MSDLVHDHVTLSEEEAAERARARRTARAQGQDEGAVAAREGDEDRRALPSSVPERALRRAHDDRRPYLRKQRRHVLSFLTDACIAMLHNQPAPRLVS